MVKINMAHNLNYNLLFKYIICESYKLTVPKYFSTEILLTDEKVSDDVKEVVQKIFGQIGVLPVKLLAYSKEIDANGNLITSPHDFLLNNGKTLSVKINQKKGNDYKVAPCVVGQAGYNVLNSYFENIYGEKIETQSDIKKLFWNKLEAILPIFIEKTFVSDYTLFFEMTNEDKFIVVDKDKIKIPTFEKKDFTFSRSLEEWKESNTIKYKNITIAEIQTHHNRTFKFRFFVGKLLEFIYNFD